MRLKLKLSQDKVMNKKYRHSLQVLLKESLAFYVCLYLSRFYPEFRR